jgi:Immunity protein 32
MLLTVEYDPKGVVEIHSDKEGLDLLLTRLQALKAHGGHEHLMTPAWAGNELTEEKQGAESELINHLKITLWPD